MKNITITQTPDSITLSGWSSISPEEAPALDAAHHAKHLAAQGVWFDYVLDRALRVTETGVECYKSTWGTPLERTLDYLEPDDLLAVYELAQTEARRSKLAQLLD